MVNLSPEALKSVRQSDFRINNSSTSKQSSNMLGSGDCFLIIVASTPMQPDDISAGRVLESIANSEMDASTLCVRVRRHGVLALLAAYANTPLLHREFVITFVAAGHYRCRAMPEVDF